MQGAIAALRGGAAPDQALAEARTALLVAGFDSIDYLSFRDAAALGPMGAGPARLLAAATVGGVRLIDNMGV
jgi:pantoate--beta-alanine ligase